MNLKKQKSRILIIFALITLVWCSVYGVAYANSASATLTITSSNVATASKDVSATVKVESGCLGDTYTAQTATLTVKNGSGSAAILSFDYEMTGKSYTVDGEESGASGSVTKSLAANGTIDLVATTDEAQNATSSVKVSNFSLIIDSTRTLTFYAAEGGTITVGGTSVSDSKTVTTNYSTGVAVTATAGSGYTFYGWVDANQNRLSSTANTTIRPTADASITPLFVPDTSTQTYWGVGSKIFDDLDDALTAAESGTTKKVVLLRDGTLDAHSYTIKSGITVLIPFDEGGTIYTTVPEVTYDAYTTPSAFRILTMPAGASITVKSGGAISISSRLSSKGQYGGYNGTPTGPDGRIHMFTGSSITLESGANLYCWGYIYGGGSITAQSGSTVYEAFQVKDWRGGTATSNCYDYTFIFNQYYVQNIEVPLTVYAGASEKLYSSVNASSSAYPIGATLIGTGGMFKVTSGYVVKDYLENADQLSIKVYGDISISPLEISGVPVLGSVTTSDYRLPINNMRIDIQSGTASLSQDLEFLPCSEVYVAKGATFEVSSGKKVYLYDADDWGNFTGKAKLYAVGYSVANGTTAVRTADNLRDAKIDVDGTVSVKGSLFTSEGGANITSSQGYDGTNGKVVFSTAPTAKDTISEMENNSSETSVTFVAPMLHNGDDTYSLTAGTGKSTWKYDKDGEHWYRYLVDFKFNNTLIQRGFFCENGDTVTYDASWLTNLGASASSGTATISGTDVNVTDVTADSVVTLTGTPAEYIPTFVLNAHQYSLYQLYTGSTISDTATIDGDTYYIVDQGSSALAVGTAYTAPTDADMGVTSANHNAITWNMSGLSATSGDPYRGTVPTGETAQGPAYIYGFYTGYVAYNSYTDAYYTTLAGAMENVPQDGSCTVTLIAPCGSFEEESGTLAFPNPKETTLTIDLNGFEALGRILNYGNLTLELNGGTWNYKTGATAAASTYRGMAAVINSGTMTVQDSVGGGKVTADAIGDNSSLTNYVSCIRNNAGAALTVTGGTLATTQTTNTYCAAILNYGAVTGLSDTTLTVGKGYSIYNSAGTIGDITDCTFTSVSASSLYNLGTTSVLATVGNITGTTINGGTHGVYSKYGAVGNIDHCEITGTANTAVYNEGTAAKAATIGDITNSTLTAKTYGIQNSYGRIESIVNCTIDSSITTTTTNYTIYNYNTSTIPLIQDCTLTSKNATVLYNYNGGTVTTLKNTSLTITTPTTKNVYVLFNYGGTITTIDNCTIKGNSGINNRNQRTSAGITAGYAIAYNGTIGTISNSYVSVGQYALYNGGIIDTLSGSTFEAAPASAQVNQATGTAALNSNTQCYTIVNSNLWWYDNAVWKRTDTTVDNNGTTMVQRRINEYKTDDAYMPTIGTITDCTIIAYNTSTNAGHGYALQNYGVINTITGSTTIKTEAHKDNAKISTSQYALQNINGGKIGTIDSGVTITANNYAIDNRGARYAQTDVTYSTTYLDGGTTLKSTGLVTDYDYTYADVSYIGEIAATVSAVSTYAIQNYAKIGSITGTVSANYNVIVNQVAAATTTGIEAATANTRAIEHRYFTGDDSSLAANEYSRYFEYTRNTTDGCYIGSITGTVTATGKGYQAIYNQGYIGTLGGTISTQTGLATSGSTYYPLIYNGDQRQATLKQTETYYVESNNYGATKYEREYTFEVPTINTISCTATNPQDYTIRNLGTINTLSGDISGKTITVANEAGGTYLTRKTIQFYSSASLLAATQKSTEVNYEYTKQQAKINTIDGATITTTGSTYTLRNYGYIGTIKNSTITSKTTNTIYNYNSTITTYTSNHAELLTGCTPSASACTLVYDMTQALTESEQRAIAVIDTIGEGNTISGTGTVLQNRARINTIDSGSGTRTTIIGQAKGTATVYNYEGQTTTRDNTATLTDVTGTKTDSYSNYTYVPASIGIIKNVYIQSSIIAIQNGNGSADYTKVEIGEIGEGTEVYGNGAYNLVYNFASNAQIAEISGGIFRSNKSGAYYAIYNASTTYPILLSGGDFRNYTTGSDTGRQRAVYKFDDSSYITYPEGKYLSSAKNTRTPSNAVNSNVKVAGYYFITEQYTVTFNANGVDGTMDAQTIEKGVATALTANTFTRTGYTFDSWNTAADGTGTAYTDKQSVTLSADLTLYAQWKAKNATVSVSCKYGDITLKDYTTSYTYDGALFEKPQYTYYTFKGWKIGDTTYDPDNETECANLKAALNDAVAEGTELTVTAVFERDTYTVQMFSFIPGVDDDDKPGEKETDPKTYSLGRSVRLTAGSSVYDDDRNRYYFDHWIIGTSSGYKTVYETYDQRITTFFPTESGEYYAIAVYTEGAKTYSNNVSFRVVNTTTEKVGDELRAVVTVELMGPKGGYSMTEIGLNYLVAASLSGAGDITSDGTSSSYDTSNSSLVRAINDSESVGGTATFRIPLSEGKNLYSFAFATYSYPKTGDPVDYTAAMATDVGYDTVAYPAG